MPPDHARLRHHRLVTDGLEAGGPQLGGPEHGRGRELGAHAKTEAERVLGDAPQPPGPLARQTTNLAPDDPTVVSGRPPPEHHVSDRDASFGTKPIPHPGQQGPLLLVREMVEGVARHNEVEACRWQIHRADVGRSGRDVDHPARGGLDFQRLQHGRSQVDRQHVANARRKRQGHEPGPSAEIRCPVRRLRPGLLEEHVEHLSKGGR